MSKPSFTFLLPPGTFAVCQLPKDAVIPEWATSGKIFSVTRTLDELSIVCAQELVPANVRCERGWCCFKLHGPFAFDVTGVVASFTPALAEAGVGIFVVSTFDTDYLFVKTENREKTVLTLQREGHTVR